MWTSNAGLSAFAKPCTKATTLRRKRKVASETFPWDRHLNEHFVNMLSAAELQMIHSSSLLTTELISDREICTNDACFRHARRHNSHGSAGMISVERTRRCSVTWANH